MHFNFLKLFERILLYLVRRCMVCDYDNVVSNDYRYVTITVRQYYVVM